MNLLAKNSNKQYKKPIRWALQHYRACAAAWMASCSTPLASVVTWMVIGLSMALPLGLFVLLNNLDRLQAHWQNHPTLTIYLKSTGNNTEKQKQFFSQLKSTAGVKSIKYISPEQGLAELQQNTSSRAWLKSLPNNPLPGVVVITPKDNWLAVNKLQHLQQQLAQFKQIDNVQLDTQWVTRFNQFIALGQRFNLALILLFATTVMLTTANTIRLTTQHHREEMRVLRLIGATARYVRRPLLYRGAIYGGLGGLVAIIFIALLINWLQTPAAQLAHSYQTNFQLQALTLSQVAMVIAGGCALGIFGASIAFKHHDH